MQKTLFTILFNLIGCAGLLAQDIQLLSKYANEQFDNGNYSIALKEFQRILLFDQEHKYDDIYANIASIYFSAEDYNNAIVYFDFARKAVQKDSLKLEFTFKKTLCYYKQGKFLIGLSELYDLPNQLSPYFETKKYLYFAICHYGLEEHAESLNYFEKVVDSTGLKLIDSSLVELNKFQKKYDPDRLEMMSIFLPGLGQTYAGDVGAGLNSLLLLTAITGYAYYTMPPILFSTEYWFYLLGFTDIIQEAAEKHINLESRKFRIKETPFTARF